MGNRFERDDRVRLQKAMAVRFAYKAHGLAKRTNWIKRQGTVVRVARVADHVSVLWDDRASVDQWPTRALEKI